MSVLVNESPTGDFEVVRGLGQGDPLSPFLFVIIAEGLSGLVKKATEIGEFQGFLIQDSFRVELL